jgi:hypothetical protein
MLCSGNGWGPFFWVLEEGELTCKICMDLAMMVQNKPEKANPRQINGD